MGNKITIYKLETKSDKLNNSSKNNYNLLNQQWVIIN